MYTVERRHCAWYMYRYVYMLAVARTLAVPQRGLCVCILRPPTVGVHARAWEAPAPYATQRQYSNTTTINSPLTQPTNNTLTLVDMRARRDIYNVTVFTHGK